MKKKKIKVNKIFLNNEKHGKRYELLYGGAGSGKSVWVSQKIIRDFINEDRNYLIIRKTAKSNRDSTFAELRARINEMGIIHVFKINESNLLIELSSGRKIIFAGLDDVEKLKSISFPVGKLTNIWIEEASEISLEDFQQLDLRLRGKTKVNKQITLTFNPISHLSWLKKRFFDTKEENAFILKTTYLNNEFLDDEYKNVLENLREQDEIYYNIYALGNWGVLGNLVFNNYEICNFDIEDEYFESICNGLDFGYNDPACYLSLGLKDNDIYIRNEFYRSQMTVNELIKAVKKQFPTNQKIIADSANPGSIKEFKKQGFSKIQAAKKGPDSIRHGIDWLRSRKIFIHAQNCPETAKEIQQYKYREDRNGTVTEEPVDLNNHAMDSLRYGTEIWRRERKIEFLK